MSARLPLLLLASGLCASAGAAPLLNPGFEDGLTHWDAQVYGAQSQVAADEDFHRAGRRSLKIAAGEPSDTALAQEVALDDGRWYRASVWIKTQGLAAVSASTLGALEVQLPGGRGTLASSANHVGDTAWIEEAVCFQCPAGGKVRVSLFLAGYGTGTGTAWFDDVCIEPIDLAHGRVRIADRPLVEATISPYQYGQFVEYLCDLVPSMWAEKLYDGSFEGLTPYKLVYLKETDFKERPWHPSGATNRAEYALDKATQISGEVSQRIAVADGPPCRVGLAQDGLFVGAAAACTLSCYLRAEGLSRPVQVRIERAGRVAAACEFAPTAQWQKFAAKLVCDADVVDGTLSIEFVGPGTLWIDNASLMPVDNVGGWRPDVVEAVRALRPGIIRFGGSALDDASLGQFEWTDTIGDVDRRRPFRAWGGLQPTGPGLEEIVQFCQAVGAEPFLCVRFTQRTPADAAAQVEYFNGAPDTPGGARRAANGHREPYGVKFWQVGNEVQSAEYDRQLAAFCRAMHRVDPTIQIVSSFPSVRSIELAADELSHVAPHYYNPNLPQVERDLVALGKLIERHAPRRRPRVAVSEWNTTAGDAGPRRAMLWTLANALACAKFHHIWHRHCDLVEITNRSNLINSFCSGILQADRRRLYKTPTYYAQWLYANLAGNRPLALESDVPTGVGLDCSATLAVDGRQVVLFAVNDTLEPLARTLDFSPHGAGGQTLATWTLADSQAAGEPDVANSFAEPERIAARQDQLTVAGPTFDYTFPPLSLSVLVWRK